MSAPAPRPLDRERDVIAPRRALVSVSDKSGLAGLALVLHAAGVEIVSTGSTAAAIRDAGVPVTEVSELTGFPESLDGRVKTLHPAVHAGILADLRLVEHERQLAELGIGAFELVVVNLYPFAETVARGAGPAETVEQIDIGGPALVRAAAKNHANVAIVVDPERYAELGEAVRAGGTDAALRRELAAEAFAHTAGYDAAVAEWFAQRLAAEAGVAQDALAPEADGEGMPGELCARFELLAPLRYGENAHQRAALYGAPDGVGVAQARQLSGKEMSYNNYVDADAALRCAFDFAEPAVAIVKHANPCGVAIAPADAGEGAIAESYRRAHATDPVSAFGGVIAANRPVSAEMARAVAEVFTEVLAAPGFEPEALELLRERRNLRLLELPEGFAREALELRQISGGALLQTADAFPRGERPSGGWRLAAGEPVDEAMLRDLEFAWVACRAVKSNGILLASAGAAVGVGMGQVNRVDSCRLAVQRAGERAAGSVAASDAFFPFADGVRILLEAGVRALVQPGGSVRDEEVLAAVREAGASMYVTGERHFFH
ncbi:MAG: bifunctional phosphoribosylaminoimidazolecarboxamide formyltransferase/IMP cyclohydrolase [Pseudoclavibacter sp.]|nr:bifunctional phosphoribosylaminoimidazolecarboxamide formyltransferase/IMP cyclohydrolase [Pseudoclavibacter sp.]